jgi:multidrug efflux pump subunit AcrA (membrane-fusion protein)
MSLSIRSILILLLVSCLTACNPASRTAAEGAEGGSGENADNHAENEGSEGVIFREGKGLEVPNETKAFLNVKTAEVSEDTLRSQATYTGQIYESRVSGALESDGKIMASVMVDPKIAETIEVDQKVMVGKDKLGAVAAVNRSAIAATGQAEILISLSVSDAGYKLGDSIQITFASPAREGVSTIPRSALLETINGNFVYVPNGKYFFKTAVTVGAKSEKAVEIVEGLYPGDEVVSEPVDALWLAELQATKGGVGCADGH